MILAVQTDDAATALETLSERGAPVMCGIADEPWDHRRFMMRDPAGVLLDIVEQTAPAEGFWDRYMPP